MEGIIVFIGYISTSCMPVLAPLLIGISINTKRMRDDLSRISRIMLLKTAIISWALLFLGLTLFNEFTGAFSITPSLITVSVIILVDTLLTFYLGYRLRITKEDGAIRFPWSVMGIDALRLTNNVVFLIAPNVFSFVLFLFLPTILAVFGAIAVFFPPRELIQKL